MMSASTLQENISADLLIHYEGLKCKSLVCCLVEIFQQVIRVETVRTMYLIICISVGCSRAHSMLCSATTRSPVSLY